MSLGDEARRVHLRLRSMVKPRLAVFGARWLPSHRRRDREADVLLAWFPKTGGTWVRLMLSTVLARHAGVRLVNPLDFEALARAAEGLPRIRAIHEDEPHWKTPEQLTVSKAQWRDRKVILLVRDPRDTLVSLHFQMTRRWRVTDLPMDAFVFQRRGGLDTMLRYYNLWAAARAEVPALHMVRYEDLHRDPVGELSAILAFLGLNAVPASLVEEAVAENRIERMRKREAALEFDTHRLRPGDPEDPESFKARRGKVGGFVDYLAPETIARMEAVIEAELDPWYGYRRLRQAQARG